MSSRTTKQFTPKRSLQHKEWVVAYTVNGVQYQGKLGNHEGLEKGSKIEILYNPEQIASPNLNRGNGIFTTLGNVFIILACWGLLCCL